MSTKTTAVPPAPTFDPALLAKLAKVDPHAVLQLADYGGPSYFNPVLGYDDGETFGNVADVMGMLYSILEKYDGLCEIQPGIKLVVQTVWTACQYEAQRREVAE